MTGCSADYCTNSSSKGFRMYTFSSNPKRRKIWIDNVNRADWLPGPHAALCNIQFIDQMFQMIRNGKRRLKNTAVPTVFDLETIKNESQKYLSIQEGNANNNANVMDELMDDLQHNVDNLSMTSDKMNAEQNEFMDHTQPSINDPCVINLDIVHTKNKKVPTTSLVEVDAVSYDGHDSDVSSEDSILSDDKNEVLSVNRRAIEQNNESIAGKLEVKFSEMERKLIEMQEKFKKAEQLLKKVNA